MSQNVDPEGIADLINSELPTDSADRSTSTDQLFPQTIVNPTSLSPSVSLPWTLHADMLTGLHPSDESVHQLPKQTDKALLKLLEQYDQNELNVDEITPRSIVDTSSVTANCITEKRNFGTFLKPLSFPESQNNMLSCFLGPEMDLPLSCLLCSETFGLLPKQRPVTVEKKRLSDKVGTLCDSNCRLLSCPLKGAPYEVPNMCSKCEAHDVDGHSPDHFSCDTINTTTKHSSSTRLETSQSKIVLEEKKHSLDVKSPNHDGNPPDLNVSPKDAWLQHLVREHNIVISNIKDISSLKCYSEYWKSRLTQAPITDFTPVIRTNMDSDIPSEDYYLYGDILPEDKDLRLQLHRMRLETVLEFQQKEREETQFSRRCLFCSQCLTGNRTILFQHMLESHGFNVGQADNLVFVNAFLDLLQEKLDSLQCLFCERTFRDRVTLKDHMRKKGHKKINSQNKAYDRFYIINYLEFGKTWEQIQSEDDKELSCADEIGWSEWSEPLKDPVFCLFCLAPCTNVDSVLCHMKEVHSFDLTDTFAKMHLDYYRQIKLVNFIRRKVYSDSCVYCSLQSSSSKELLQHMRSSCHFMLPSNRAVWDQPQHLFPTYENDSLLYALEDDSLSTNITD